MLPFQGHKAAKSGEVGFNPCLPMLGSLLIETGRCFCPTENWAIYCPLSELVLSQERQSNLIILSAEQSTVTTAKNTAC